MNSSLLLSLTWLLAVISCSLSKRYPPVNIPGRGLVVLNAPSVWDRQYHADFATLVGFFSEFVRNLIGRDNVLLLVDKHTMPFYENKLPSDVLLESHLYDISLRDFAPLQVGDKVTKFRYKPNHVDPLLSQIIDGAWSAFAETNFLDTDTSDLILDGSSVVDNGLDRALVPDEVFSQNANVSQDWAIRIRLRNFFKKPLPLSIRNLTAAGASPSAPRPALNSLMQWIEPDLLLMAELNEPSRTSVRRAIREGYRKEVMIVELHNSYKSEPTSQSVTHQKRASTCGLHTAVLPTSNYIYMPVYGNDPTNWKRGYGSLMDKHSLQMIQVNTHKQVIPISVPYAICGRIGASLPGLAWKLHGDTADHLISLARMRANLRRFLLSRQNQNLLRPGKLWRKASDDVRKS